MNLTCLALQSHRSMKPNQITRDMLFNEVLKTCRKGLKKSLKKCFTLF